MRNKLVLLILLLECLGQMIRSCKKIPGQLPGGREIQISMPTSLIRKYGCGSGAKLNSIKSKVFGSDSGGSEQILQVDSDGQVVL